LRLDERESEVLRFATDFRVPFDNDNGQHPIDALTVLKAGRPWLPGRATGLIPSRFGPGQARSFPA
jgi:hypothetical protein